MFDVTHDDGVATLRMDHGKVNALDTELCRALAEELRRLDADADVRAIVLTGNGRAFGAGVHLQRLLELDADATAEFLDALCDVLRTPYTIDTPIVAAVDGHAIAGGALLALACDHVLLTDDLRARVGLSELAVGVPYPPVPFELAAHRLRSAHPIVDAQLYPTDDAVEHGFGHEVVPDDHLQERAVEIAQRLAAVPRGTFSVTKAMLRRPMEHALADSAARHDEVVDLWSSDEVRSAIRRFLDGM